MEQVALTQLAQPSACLRNHVARRAVAKCGKFASILINSRGRQARILSIRSYILIRQTENRTMAQNKINMSSVRRPLCRESLWWTMTGTS